LQRFDVGPCFRLKGGRLVRADFQGRSRQQAHLAIGRRQRRPRRRPRTTPKMLERRREKMRPLQARTVRARTGKGKDGNSKDSNGKGGTAKDAKGADGGGRQRGGLQGQGRRQNGGEDAGGSAKQALRPSPARVRCGAHGSRGKSPARRPIKKSGAQGYAPTLKRGLARAWELGKASRIEAQACPHRVQALASRAFL